MSCDHLSAFEHRSGVEFIPVSFRDPDVHGCKSVLCRLGHRRYEHVVSEHILAAEIISLLAFRIVVVKRAAERDTLIISLACHCIDVWCHLIALTYGLADHVGILLCENPRLLVQRAAL